MSEIQPKLQKIIYFENIQNHKLGTAYFHQRPVGVKCLEQVSSDIKTVFWRSLDVKSLFI